MTMIDPIAKPLAVDIDFDIMNLALHFSQSQRLTQQNFGRVALVLSSRDSPVTRVKPADGWEAVPGRILVRKKSIKALTRGAIALLDALHGAGHLGG
jgi:hypothetical protein